MSESRLSVMRVFLTLVLTCVCFKLIIAQQNDDLDGGDSNSPKVYMDQQIVGFNSTNITSGPVILVDKRIVYITDFRYFGPHGDGLQFWVGEGISPYNDTEQYPVSTSMHFTENSLNFYLTLPEKHGLDSVNYLLLRYQDQPLDYALFGQVDRKILKEYDPSNMEDSLYRIPKCCKADEYYSTEQKCAQASTTLDFNIKIFESNETGLDPDVIINSTDYQIIPYYRKLKCASQEVAMVVPGSELHGIIYNKTLIVQGQGIYNHREFCMDGYNGSQSIDLLVLVCMQTTESNKELNFYLPPLILSTLCFALSTAAYGMILKRKDIHKRCFIMFSSSMCLAFVCLIVMQVQNSVKTCNTIGFVFLLTVSLSFLWLLILCLELLYQVIRPIEDKRYNLRWDWYCGISFGLSLLTFLISLLTGEQWVPDVPNSFIMPYGDITNMCEFQTPLSRAFIVFTPIIVSILGSSASLIALQPCINRNEKDKRINNHFDWISHSNNYKFLSRTYIMIIIVACFWLLGIFFYSTQLDSTKTQLALDVIKASLGIVTFVGFVGNKYTRAEISNKFCKKKFTEKDLELNGYSTPPSSPGTQLDNHEDFPLMHQRNYGNLTTFQGSRLEPIG
ncbi:uncharacterized protein [Euwallacea fornicatus]|uniref:uncharacterized protein isoform X1 n=1 Tax=Euwallacea fornicatus TaxID=995702 RepID=UPI00338EF397